MTTDTKAQWKRRALRAEYEVQTMRNIRQVDNTMEQRLVAENSALRVAIAEIGNILDELERSRETPCSPPPKLPR